MDNTKNDNNQNNDELKDSEKPANWAQVYPVDESVLKQEPGFLNHGKKHQKSFNPPHIGHLQTLVEYENLVSGGTDMSEALKNMKQMRDDNFGPNEKNSDNKPK